MSIAKLDGGHDRICPLDPPLALVSVNLIFPRRTIRLEFYSSSSFQRDINNTAKHTPLASWPKGTWPLCIFTCIEHLAAVLKRFKLTKTAKSVDVKSSTEPV